MATPGDTGAYHSDIMDTTQAAFPQMDVPIQGPVELSMATSAALMAESIPGLSQITSMDVCNQLQERLKNYTSPAIGLWQTLPGADHARILARSFVDWVMVDTEHGNISDSAMYEAVAAIADSGTSPVVRVAANIPHLIKRALDTGTHGILVPQIRTAQECRDIVQACRFPPNGIRGFGSPFPMGTMKATNPKEYFDKADRKLVILVQIETREALDNIDEIAAVEGIDVLFVGPFDLSIALGCPIISGMVDPRLSDAIIKVVNTANNAGKKAGIFSLDAESAVRNAGLGFHFISLCQDHMTMMQTFRSEVSKFQGIA